MAQNKTSTLSDNNDLLEGVESRTARTKDGRSFSDGYDRELGRRRDRMLLMHSPMGIRTELNVTTSQLELWISPQATKSRDYWIRNFSCRDDYTTVFESISLPALHDADYVATHYDPFHSVLEYRQQKLHLLALVDSPAIVVWCESDEIIDFQADKQDTPGRREPPLFHSVHPDRGLELDFAAAAGPRGGSFAHQRSIDRGRSVYARLELSAGQVLVIGGELRQEKIVGELERLARRTPKQLIAANEKAIAAETRFGRASFRDRADWQSQYELNQRVMLSAQDWGGNLPAAYRALYYLIWHMDGAMTAQLAGYCGWASYAERWAQFEIANPTWTDGPVAGYYYGQLVNGRISKQEEWGLFFAAWIAFCHWTQTGSRKLHRGKYGQNLLEALRWLEEYCWDEDRQAVGTYYRGEDPFGGTYDAGWDEAVGRPMSHNPEVFDGKEIRRAYTFEANLTMYNVYVMLSAMSSGQKAEDLLGRAQRIVPFLRRAYEEGFSRELLLEDGSWGYDRKAPRCPHGVLFGPEPEWLVPILTGPAEFTMDEIRAGREKFAHQVFFNFIQRDPVLIGPDDFEEFLDIFLPQCRNEGEFLLMGGSLIENVNCAPGSYHDNRPQLFSTAGMQAAWVGQAVRRLAFGLAVRANDMLSAVENYAWRGGELNFHFSGTGAVREVRVSARSLTRSLQLPQSMLPQGRRSTIRVRQGKGKEPTRLLSSTARLLEVSESANGAELSIEAYGVNQLMFNRRPSSIEVRKGRSQQAGTLREIDGVWFLEFPGRGRFSVAFEE